MYMLKTAIGYMRVSTLQQTREGISLEAQLERIQAWCRTHGYQLVSSYQDAGISGVKRNRPGLEQVLQEIKKDMALVTYSISRVTRSLKDQLEICDYLRKKGAHLVSLTENYDTTSASGKLLFTIMGTINQYERDATSERTKAVKQYKKERMEYNGGGIPYGYRLSECKKLLLRDENEQQLLAEMQALKGLKLRRISRELCAKGYLNRKGKPFHPMQIKLLLENNYV
jgi:site-specific DNA recombinase